MTPLPAATEADGLGMEDRHVTQLANERVRRGARDSSGLFEELVVDNFAGAGGASRGIEAAVGRAVDIAINHDAHSVRMHQINHPHTRHLCEDVWDVDPLAATAGRSVGLAWFSPDCKHFSRAKGGKPVEKKIRGLAWVVIRWARLVKPRVIILENVREFQDWGPLTLDHKPCRRRKGMTFRSWRTRLEKLGYVTDCRVLNAADYGAPTHRRRFFLVARRDGEPVCWPEPTHGPGRKPYRTAAQCIDWSLACPSIFLTRPEARELRVIRPLAEKTMRRIAMGLKRFVLDNPKPFIVTCNHGGPEFRGQPVDEPFKTITGSRDAHGVVAPYITGVGGRMGQGNVSVSRGDVPLGTITSKNDRAVVAPYLAQRYGEGPHQETRGQKVDKPLLTVTPANNSGVLVAPTLVQYNGEKTPGETRGKSPTEPINTIPTENRFGLCAAFLAKHYGGVVGHGPERPLGTVTSIDHHSVVAAHVTQYFGGSPASRNKSPEDPLPTITADDHNGLVAAHMIKMNHGDKQWHAVDEPLRTVVAGANHHGVVASHLTKFYGKSIGSEAGEPLPTITGTHNHLGEVRAFLVKYFGTGGQWQRCDEPLHTILSRDRFGLVAVDGQDYAIADIGLRMLTPRELLNAQFGRYAKNYVLIGTKAQQVAGIGNSVPPELAEAMVRANYCTVMEAAA